MITCVWVFARGEGGAAKSAGRFYCLLYIAYLFTWTTWIEKLTTLWDLLCQMAVSVSCLTYRTVCTWSPRNTYLMDLWQKAYSRTKINSIDILSLAVYNFSSLTSHLTPSSQTHCHHYVVHIIIIIAKKKTFHPPPLPPRPGYIFEINRIIYSYMM